MEKTRYGWCREIYDKRLQKYVIRCYVLNWEGLQFHARTFRCKELCLHWDHWNTKCTVDGRPNDVCAYFISGMEITE